MVVDGIVLLVSRESDMHELKIMIYKSNSGAKGVVLIIAFDFYYRARAFWVVLLTKFQKYWVWIIYCSRRFEGGSGSFVATDGEK